MKSVGDLINKILWSRKSVYETLLGNLDRFTNERVDLERLIMYLDQCIVVFRKYLVYLAETDKNHDMKEIAKTVDWDMIFRGAIKHSDAPKSFKKKYTKNFEFAAKPEERFDLFLILYAYIISTSKVIPLLEKNLHIDYLMGLQKIYQSYKNDDSIISGLFILNSSVRNLAIEEFDDLMSRQESDMEFWESNIEKYMHYINMEISEYYNLFEMFEEAISIIHRRIDYDNYNSKIQKVEDYLKNHDDWMRNYTQVLIMYEQARDGHGIYNKGEREIIEAVLNNLKSTHDEMKDTTNKVKLLYSSRILEIITKYESLYPSLKRLKNWAEEQYNKYKYLDHS